MGHALIDDHVRELDGPKQVLHQAVVLQQVREVTPEASSISPQFGSVCLM